MSDSSAAPPLKTARGSSSIGPEIVRPFFGPQNARDGRFASSSSRKRLCGACENVLVGKQELWCSRACSRWVSNAGGRRAAAEIFEDWAGQWRAAFDVDRNPAYRRTARELLARARRLRRLQSARHASEVGKVER